MHTNQSVKHKRNKHGRVGVKQRPRPTPNELAEAFNSGVKVGEKAGKLSGFRQAAILADGSRSIRDLRSKLREVING